MQRYFVNHAPDDQGRFSILGEDVHHIQRVMRMKQGETLYAVFPDETSVIAIIEELTDDAVSCAIKSVEEKSTELPLRITIAHGLPKSDKLELVIQKATELGAHSFMPFIAERSIVKWDTKKGDKKVDRWNKIAKEAAEQSHRHRQPNVFTPQSFKELLEKVKTFDFVVVAYEEEAKIGEKSLFAKTLNTAMDHQSMLIIIGPEGGLTADEVTRLEEKGAVKCAFGPRILRTETAPLYALAAISYHFELMR
ncbi:16S rRNA (uracil(1498)-N(3))-methyltransferase [Jeotgalibacillus soli]|uniref:Ribosomal RNA small subunit methyltransferase E n=1 Tax=Jeotgalibacillus soli TaxID=889306 RepID=A0A0C2V646_9BACL|nr:16S rRNA (uracil(1498)-N(3))-methyltransferase [Jeotgalibacillus soli]KIL44457.1 16S rRNA methyltransferase [Jeotgalibacillus soli]